MLRPGTYGLTCAARRFTGYIDASEDDTVTLDLWADDIKFDIAARAFLGNDTTPFIIGNYYFSYPGRAPRLFTSAGHPACPVQAPNLAAPAPLQSAQLGEARDL